MQSGSVAADVTVTDDISVAQASSVLGATYDILDDAAPSVCRWAITWCDLRRRMMEPLAGIKLCARGGRFYLLNQRRREDARLT